MKRTFFILMVVLAAWSSAQAGEMVRFSYTNQFAGEVKLNADLFKPPGKGPFGAVILLHGCLGIYPWTTAWAERVKNWGYVVLMVDSLGPRRVKSTCDDFMRVSPAQRASDAWGALAYLAKQPYVDPKRIAMLGFTHGAASMLSALQPNEAKGEKRFCAAVAVSPYCMLGMDQLTAPLLILIGAKDQFCPSKLCRQQMPTGKTRCEVKLKVYPEAYAGFALEGLDTTIRGKRILYDPEAAADAVQMTRNFLAKHMK